MPHGRRGSDRPAPALVSHRTRPSAPIGCLLRSRLRHLSTCQIRPAALELPKVHESTGEAHEWLEQEHEGTRLLRAIIRDPIAKDRVLPSLRGRGWWTFSRPWVTRRSLNGRDSGGRGRRHRGSRHGHAVVRLRAGGHWWAGRGSLRGRDRHHGARRQADHDHRHAEAERDPFGHAEARADPDQDPSGRAAGSG